MDIEITKVINSDQSVKFIKKAMKSGVVAQIENEVKYYE
jgi:hypothetical protein